MFAIITLSPDFKNMSVIRLVIGDFFSYAGSTLVSSQSFSKVSRNASTSKSGCERDRQKVRCVSPKLIKLTE